MATSTQHPVFTCSQQRLFAVMLAAATNVGIAHIIIAMYQTQRQTLYSMSVHESPSKILNHIYTAKSCTISHMHY
jgi:hypothetical protein